MTPLDRITERVNQNGDLDDPSTPRPLLTLDEFFDGNDVVGSIGCNLNPTPTPDSFWQTLKQISQRQDVADIRVQVTMFDVPEWPFSDVVWIMTSANTTEVASWFPEAIRPDECSLGWPDEGAIEACPVPTGMHPVACWWD